MNNLQILDKDELNQEDVIEDIDNDEEQGEDNKGFEGDDLPNV
jgi:hypothetical protein